MSPADRYADYLVECIEHLVANEEEAEDNMPECHSVDVTVSILCYGGGPAGGVEFDLNQAGDDWVRARTWNQEWFEPRKYSDLDEDTAQFLWDWWDVKGKLA